MQFVPFLKGLLKLFEAFTYKSEYSECRTCQAQTNNNTRVNFTMGDGRSTIGQLSVDYQSTVGRLPVDCWLIVSWLPTDSQPIYRSIAGLYVDQGHL